MQVFFKKIKIVKAYGYVPLKWVIFSPKILKHEFHFGQKKSLEECSIS